MKTLLPSATISSICEFWFPSDLTDYELWCKREGHDPEDITHRACDIGHMVEKLTFNPVPEDPAPKLSTDDMVTAKAIANHFSSFLKEREPDWGTMIVEQNVKYEEDGACLYHGRYDFALPEKKKLYDMKTWGAWNASPLKPQEWIKDKLMKAKFQVFLYYKCTGFTPHILYIAVDGYRIYRLSQVEIDRFEEMHDLTIKMLKMLGKTHFDC